MKTVPIPATVDPVQDAARRILEATVGVGSTDTGGRYAVTVGLIDYIVRFERGNPAEKLARIADVLAGLDIALGRDL